jgi:hypothetical protein
MKKILPFLFPFLFCCIDNPSSYIVFSPEKDGYKVFRIVSLLQHKNYLIAITEGRESYSDHGNIDLILKVSSDNGNSWGPTQMICDYRNGTCGTPAAVSYKDKFFIMMNINTNNSSLKDIKNGSGERRTLIVEGTIYNGSALLTIPKDITEQIKPKDMNWDAIGPGNGIVTSDGIIIMPAIRRNIISVDGGKTWFYEMVIPDGPKTNESSIVELSNGSLLRADRPNEPSYENWHTWKYRKPTTMGVWNGYNWDWTPYYYQPDLIVSGHRCDECSDNAETCKKCIAGCYLAGIKEENCEEQKGIHCQSSLGRIGKRLFITAPGSAKDRVKLTLYLSDNEGKTWYKYGIIHHGRSGYSSATVLNNDDNILGVLYEAVVDGKGCVFAQQHEIHFKKVFLTNEQESDAGHE